MHSVEQVTEPVILAEGPHWDAKEQVLYYVDLNGFSVHRYDPTSKSDSVLKLDKTISAIIPVKDSPGKFIIGYGTNVTLLEWDGKSDNHKIQNKFQVDTDKTGTRFNDGKADPRGNVWMGTMAEEIDGVIEPEQGTLYRVSSCKLDTILTPVTISNGLAWNSENNIMYYIDSPTGKVEAFDYDINTATIKNRRTFFDFAEKNVEGMPDGMTIDNDDNLWIACWGASQVVQVSKEGDFMRSIEIPATRVTSAVWGGPNFDILYVTTMKAGLTEEQLQDEPLAGAVFAVTGLGVTGRENYQVSKYLLTKKE